MINIEMRELTPVNYTDYVSLVRELSPQGKSPVVSDMLTVSKLVMWGFKKIFLAYDTESQKYIGTISLIREPKINRENKTDPKNTSFCGHIEDVVVTEDRRKQGLGKYMVEYAVSYAKSCACYKVILTCSRSTSSFYRKCGFLENEIEMRIDL